MFLTRLTFAMALVPLLVLPSCGRSHTSGGGTSEAGTHQNRHDHPRPVEG